MMSTYMIRRLVYKDWYLHRLAISLMFAGIVLGLVLCAMSDTQVQVIGLNLVMAIFVALTFYLPLSTVLSERLEKTLAFVMSLPVSPSEYTAAKILSNMLLYAIPLGAVMASLGLVFDQGLQEATSLSDGHLHVILLSLLVVFSFVLSFAIITESMGWTVALIVVLLFTVSNVLMQVLQRIPGVRQFMADIAHQGSEYYLALGGEVFTILALLTYTFIMQARKKDFL